MKLVIVFIAEFLFSLHFAATLYINSSFLEHFYSLHAIGILYGLGALASTLLFLIAPSLLNWLGTKRFLLTFLLLTLGATIGAGFSATKLYAAVFFLLYSAVSIMVFYVLDVLVEEHSANKKTGEIRGIYLTLMSTATVMGPIFITVIGVSDQFKAFYIAAGAILVPLYFFLLIALKHSHHGKHYHPHSLPFLLWWKKKGVRNVTLARTMLEFFYAFMAIYMPIYLHTFIGFTWTEIGVIFSIMLLPFIIFEWPVGELADRKIGERPIMAVGFLIMLISLLFMPSLGKVAVAWAIALFASRVGASFIEITTESYFFKQINSKDTGLISIFRLSRSVGLMLGAIVGAYAVAMWPMSSIFWILAVASFLGWRFSRKLN